MKIITIEEHFINPEMTAATRDEIEKMAPSHPRAFVADFGSRQTMQFPQLFDIGAGRIADMDAHGIDMQILSCNSPAAELLPSPLAVELAQKANDQLAAAIKAYPDRFMGFATLPMADPEAAVAELKRCVRELGFKGAMINGTAHGRFMDHPDFEPFFAAAAELGVPLYFHPSIVNRNVRDAYYDNPDPAFAARFASAGIGWHYEVGIHVMRLIFAGVFDRHPDLQIITGHWGELIPYYIDRINTFFPASASPMKHDFKYYMQHNVYITPSGMFNLPQLQNALQTMGADRIIYSADYPYYPNKGAREFLENAPMSQADKEKIAHGNAEKLFKLKKTVGVVDVYHEFKADPAAATAKYTGKQIEISGVVIRTGPDIHSTPSIELSTATGEKRYAVCVFNSFDQLKGIAIGDRIIVRGNFHIFSSGEWGIVLKQATLLEKK